MKILQPTHELPVSKWQPGKRGHSKYANIEAVARTTNSGQWIPVECENRAEAIRVSQNFQKKPEFEQHVRGLTVYVRQVAAH